MAGQEVWTNITEPDASTAAKKMYNSTEYTSDLINSYAWDTAIVYIQKMGNKNYANEKAGAKTKENTGGTKEEKCHIYDMAGNVKELTTEHSKYAGYQIVTRGGTFMYSGHWTAHRYFHSGNGGDWIGFRTILYLK